MMLRKKFSRLLRLLMTTIVIAMVWMVAMVVYLDWAVNRGRSRSKDQTPEITVRNKLRGILGHNQDSNFERLDFVQNVIEISEESKDEEKTLPSTRKNIDSVPFFIDAKNDVGHVTREDHFDLSQGQIIRGQRSFEYARVNGEKNAAHLNKLKHFRTTTLGSRGQILPSFNRDKVANSDHQITKQGRFYPQKQTKMFQNPVTMGTDPPKRHVVPTLRKPVFQPLSLPFCTNTRGCYLSPYRTLTGDEERDLDYGMKRHSFNVRASEKKPLDRRVPDTRPSSCLSRTVNITALPSASIIICFHNEALSTLLRTLSSIFLRSPRLLLKEVILVDDASSFDYLQSKFESYVNNTAKIKLIRLKKRQGLIRARIIGARSSSGDVLVFLDSHCECNTGWLEPLLEEIRLNTEQIVCPDVDVIKPETFDYVRALHNVRGSFDWNLDFQWEKLPNSIIYQRKTEADKIPTPVMIGGLFAVDRHYFFNIGAYDEEMDIWGGENLEISFRVWMCGGRIEIVPCSRVGHVFRRTIPYKFPNGSYLTIQRNLVRVAEVWMDRYKKYYYTSRAMPSGFNIDQDSLASRKRLRERLKCNDFDWYLRTVAVDVDIPPIYAQYYGEMRNQKSGMCLDSLDADEGAQPLLMACHGQRGNQLFYITVNGDFIHLDVCLTMSSNGETVIFVTCETAPTKWIVSSSGQLQVLGYDNCLSAVNLAVELTACNKSDISQLWTFSYHFDYSLLTDL